MKSIASIFLYLVLILLSSNVLAQEKGLQLTDKDGLYAVRHQKIPKKLIEDGYRPIPDKKNRVEITHAVFRRDSKDQELYWFEVDLTKFFDPGDYYTFCLGQQNYKGFKVRGVGNNVKGCRWALAVSNKTLGRYLLAKVTRAYNLPPKNSVDKTKS